MATDSAEAADVRLTELVKQYGIVTNLSRPNQLPRLTSDPVSPSSH